MGDIPAPDSHHRTAFVLASTPYGAMLVNRFDYDGSGEVPGAGVGIGLLDMGEHEGGEISLLCDLATHRQETAGLGVVVIDGGANIGTHTIALARSMRGWGSVMAFEVQEATYYALAGNIALNNLFNAHASLAALAAQRGTIDVPRLDPCRPANFGGLSLNPQFNKQGQGTGMQTVPAVALDDLKLQRLDILKLDIEGMEPDALEGAQATIERLKPIVFAEVATCGNLALRAKLPGYQFLQCGMNLLAVHDSDRLRDRMQITGNGISWEG